MKSNYQILTDDYLTLINDYIHSIFIDLRDKNADCDELINKCIEPMWWSISAGGKRIRAMLTLEFCRICGGDAKIALPVAAAIEMIHTYSLIHDDLPCMDNDDYRRGRLSCHKKFGEEYALLAGDLLQNIPYILVSSDNNLRDDIKIQVIKRISISTGIKGMIGGQVLDLFYEKNNNITREDLIKMYNMKTGALIRVACEAGCICGGGSESDIKKAGEYGEILGLAFQIIDDILDITSTTEELGKPVGSDIDSGKSTLVSILGITKAQGLAEKFTDNALQILDSFDNSEFLTEMTKNLLNRKI